MIRPAALLIVSLLAALLTVGCGGRAIMNDDPTMRKRVQREVVELHAFFQDWFRGNIPETDASFARFADAMAPGFTIITPGGASLDREAILAAVRSGYGRDASASLWIENTSIAAQRDGVIVATYEEWQSMAGAEPRGRLSTCILEPNEHAPGGLLWLHVHETWLPEDRRPAQ